MGRIKNFFRKLFCIHDWEFLSHTTIYDEENYYPIERWAHKCRRCGKVRVTTNVHDERKWFF